MSTIACVVIAGGKRRALIDGRILPSVLSQGFDEVIVVGGHHPPDEYSPQQYRYLHVPDMMRSTNDALIKRDVGTLATSADYILYLSDDHALLPDPDGEWAFARRARKVFDLRPEVGALVPWRFADHPSLGRIHIPNGEEGPQGYCAGHSGVFRRQVVMDRPWTAQPHDRLWDLLASRNQMEAGVVFMSIPDLTIIDLEPERCPWN